jgi:flavorubredoxin
MNTPEMLMPSQVAPDTELLGAYLPVPGFGVLPVNAFVIKATEPVLVDTGLAAVGEDFMGALRSAIAPEDIRWIWMTHMDVDHIGNLAAVLEAAPRARVVTTFVGMAKMGLNGLPVERAYLLNPGQHLDVGDRQLHTVSPPTFDAPETTGLYDARSQTLFSSDCFGALMEAPAATAMDIDAAQLRDGALTWATIDAPWLHMLDPARFDERLKDIQKIGANTVLSSHLPPAKGMTETLLGNLRDARTAPAFAGPDQAALEQLMAVA